MLFFSFSLSAVLLSAFADARTRQPCQLPIKGGTQATDTRVTPTDLTDDYSWVKNYTAIGDSYSAGIGAGTLMKAAGDDECQRFSGAYPMIVEQLLGANNGRSMQFIACSGALSVDIRQQIAWLPKQSQDLVTVTAGGNDALLTNLLKNCIYMPTSGDTCTTARKDTQEVIEKKLQANIEQMLKELQPKMAKNGLVIYSLYGQFFNDKTDSCDGESWDWMSRAGVGAANSGNKLTKELRGQLNDLARDCNTKILAAISNIQKTTDMNIQVAEVDNYAGDNGGRFCEQGSADKYADPSNAGPVFKRLDRGYNYVPSRKLKARSGAMTQKLAKRKMLSKRLDIPQPIKETFHPSILGHTVYAGKIMEAIDVGRQAISKKTREPQCSQPKVTTVKNCLKSKLGAPQRDSDGTPSVDSSIREWCKKRNGDKVKKGGDAVWDRYQYWYYSYWLAASYNDSEGCANEVSISEDECVNKLTGGMGLCDPNSGVTHGVEVNSECLTYTIDLGTSLSDSTPPPSIETVEGDSCTKANNDNSIDRSAFEKVRDAWCKDPNKNLPESDDYSEQFSFAFEKQGDKCDDLKKDCVDTVNKLWLRCSDNPDDSKKSPNDRINAKKGPLSGSGITKGKCGIYTFELKEEETPPEPDLKCTGLNNKNWMTKDGLTNAINDFCGEVQNHESKDKGEYKRQYNAGENDDVDLAVGWSSGSSKPTKKQCLKYLNQIRDDCDKDTKDKQNPLGWKHGGKATVGDAYYEVTPRKSRYVPGICAVHLQWRDDFHGANTPGFQRYHTFYIKRILAKDSNGAIIGGMDEMVRAGAGNPYNLGIYYNNMEITPEANGNNEYIHYTIGHQQWHSDQKEGQQRCNVGAWSSRHTRATQDMDCFFWC